MPNTITVNLDFCHSDFTPPDELEISEKQLSVVRRDITNLKNILEEAGSSAEMLSSFKLNIGHYDDSLLDNHDLCGFDFAGIEYSDEGITFILTDINGLEAHYLLN